MWLFYSLLGIALLWILVSPLTCCQGTYDAMETWAKAPGGKQDGTERRPEHASLPPIA